MRFLIPVLVFLTVGAYAAEIFFNGNFATDRRGNLLLWSDITGNKPENPIGKMSVKREADGNTLMLEAYEKPVQIYSIRSSRMKKGDKLSISFKSRGKGTLVVGIYRYTFHAKRTFNGSATAVRKKLSGEWEEVKAELTVDDSKDYPTEDIRMFFYLVPGGSAEIRDFSVQGDVSDFDLVGNPSFEYGEIAFNGLAPWLCNNRFGTVKLCTEDVPDGKRCLEISSDPAKKAEVMFGWDHFVGCYQDLAVKPGTTYTISAMMKSSIESGSAGFGLQFLDRYSERLPGNPRPVKYFPLNPKLNGKGWVQVSYSFQTPAECRRLKLFVAGDNFAGKFYADKIRLQEGGSVPQIPLTKKVNEKSWTNALCFDDFIKVGSQEKNSRDFLSEVLPADVKTTVQLLTEDGSLHMRITGEEPEMANRVLQAVGHDGNPYNDDSVEIFIDPNRDRQNFYQIAINSAGVVYDAFGSDKKWDPKTLKVEVKQEKNKWVIDFSISFLDLGYGEQEYRMPDKRIGLAVFRNRKLKDRPLERSSFLQWAWPVYQDAKRFCPMAACVNGITGERVSYFYHGVDSPSTIRPRQAWKTDNPLYEELMGDKLMHPNSLIPVGDCEIGRTASGNYWWNSTAFALRSGMKYHFSEIFDLTREMRISTEMVNAFSKGSFTNRMLEKYPFAVEWYAIPQFGGDRQANYPYYRPDPKNKYMTFFFIADERVVKHFCDELEKDFQRYHPHIGVVPLGHETHNTYFKYYDEFRKAYLAQEPEVWNGFEKEAREKYGFGKFGLPASVDSATPYERLVYHRWLLDKYNRCMKDAAARLRKIKPDVVLLSEVEVGNFAAMLYENAKGTYDYITQQQVPSGSPYRQNVGFGVKIMGDLAETPVRGGPHVQHYFMSLNAEETNEVISEVFRAGGKSLALWLVDWFGKTYTDYYGAPERFAEIRHIFKEIGRMRELRFPVADTAVFFSNATRFAENWWFVKSTDPMAREYESAFTVLGPRAGSWFRFVSDVQITEQKHPLDSYKIIYVPSARYQDEATVNRLKEYAARGGTLVIGSPDMFELSDDGSKRPGLKKELMGVEVSGKDPQTADLKFGNLKVAASGNPVWKMKPVGNAKVTATFSNGDAAVISNPYGKGKVITFASNPFSFALMTDRNSLQMFRHFQQEAGCRMDQPIWRFRFPRPAKKTAPLWPKNKVCVTGNAFAWELESIVEGPNKLCPFTASYSLEPDLIPDKQKNCGALFNRRKALDLPARIRKPTIPSLQNWAAAWKSRDAFSITLNFSEAIGPGEVCLWCHGDIPSIELYSGTGDRMVKEGVSVLPANAEEVDVRKIVIPFKQKAKKFELKFDSRKNGDFYIGEMEIWSRKSTAGAN